MPSLVKEENQTDGMMTPLKKLENEKQSVTKSLYNE